MPFGLGRGGGPMVSILAIYYDDTSLRSHEAHSFSVNFYFNTDEEKVFGVGP